MTQPAHVTISSGIPRECHGTITAGVALAAHIINADLSQCEVHVKQKSRPAHGWYGSNSAFSGYAYYWYRDFAAGDKRPGGYPPPGSRIRTQPGIRYVVTLGLTNGFVHGKYPFTWQYRRYKTATAIELYTWQEELLHVAAHEFVHVKQYTLLAPHSEIECEFLAHQAVLKYRSLVAAQPASKQHTPTNTIGKAASR